MTHQPAHPHHQRILRVLRWLNTSLLRELNICFGGGTALALLLGEYRRSDDIDLVTNHLSPAQNQIALLNARHGPLFLINGPPPPGVQIGPFRAMRDKYAGAFVVDETPVRFEIIYESRLTLPAGEQSPMFPLCHVPLSCLAEMKWHALLDRGTDRGVHHRDLYDLAMLAFHNVDIVAALDRACHVMPAIREISRQAFSQADGYATRCADYRFLEVAAHQAPMLYTGLCRVATALELPPRPPFPFEIPPGYLGETRLPESDLP